MANKTPVIALNKVEKTYVTPAGEYPALKGITLTINKGEFVAIMGPSGSGKSTLMHIMGALDSPTKGIYRFNGKDISHYSRDQLAAIRNKEIGFVFQSFNLLPRTSVLNNVEKPMIYANVGPKERHTRAMEALEMVNLTEKANNLSNQLSGGQIQRVAIARALVMKPSILLADEPTGNLDTPTATEIMKFIASLHKQGNTIVIITHEQEIADFAKRLIKVRDGLVEADIKMR